MNRKIMLVAGLGGIVCAFILMKLVWNDKVAVYLLAALISTVTLGMTMALRTARRN